MHWLIATSMAAGVYSTERIASRRKELAEVRAAYGFASVTQLDFPPAGLDVIPKANLIDRLAVILETVKPDILYLPYPGDAHSDHAAVFSAAASAAKWFRRPGLHSVRCYETLSETDQGIDPQGMPFHPNLFVDISAYLARKIEILALYRSEVGMFPFPRSAEAVRALAMTRGVACGASAAEAFMILREIV